MKCPRCGTETMFVLVNINHPADILGCEECLPPELDNEDIVEICEDDFDDEDDEDGYDKDGYDKDGYDRDGYSRAYWDKWNADEDYAIEMAHGII